MTDGANPAIHDVAVNGITLSVATWGARTTPDRAVLLVHGLTANNRVWFDLGPALVARGWYVLAPDLRGRGASAKPPHGYGIPFHANDILSLCDTLDLPAVSYVGHSLGAIIGLFLAALHPARIARLIVVDAGGKLPPDAMEAIAPSLARLGVSYPSLEAYLTAMQNSAVMTWSPFWDRYFRHDAEVLPDGTAMSRVPKAAITEETAVMWATRTEALPEFVRAPTLIVRATDGLLGADKGLVLTADEAERLRTVIPGSRLMELPNTNHYTVVLPERFADEVAAFLADA